jgi:hypothetical protein
MDSLRKNWMRAESVVNGSQAGQERRISGHMAKGSVAREPLDNSFRRELGGDPYGVKRTLWSDGGCGGGCGRHGHFVLLF